MAKIPSPWGGSGCRDGWVGWPQISAFWATRHPPPPRVRVRFFWDLGLSRALLHQTSETFVAHTPPPPCACMALSKHRVGVEPPF